MNGLLSYKNASDIFNTDNASWETDVVGGRGSSYGLEIHSEFNVGKINGLLTYTLSKSDRLFEGLNNGMSFFSKFDRRHILNTQIQWRTINTNKKKQHLNMAMALSSGNRATIPIASYQGVAPPFWNNQGSSFQMNQHAKYRQQMSEVNAYQMPNYFRIDIGYSFIKIKRKYERELRVGVYNVLNRQNPYLIFYDKSRWKQLSIIPIMPSVSYSIRIL